MSGYQAPQQGGYQQPPQQGGYQQPQQGYGTGGTVTVTQTVVTTQPAGTVVSNPSQWQTGLFGCFEDFTICLTTWCCPCVSVASTRQSFDGSNWCFNCLVLNPIVLRNIVREGYNIDGDCCSDIMLGGCCPACSICQSAIEVKKRGPVSLVWGSNRPSTPQQWRNQLFGCFGDFGTCIYGWCCPSCAHASARTKFDGSNWCFNACCVPPCLVRSIIREGYNIEGGCCGDMCTTCMCMPCSGCQLLMETQDRGTMDRPKNIV